MKRLGSWISNIKHTANFWTSLLAFPNTENAFTVLMEITRPGANRKPKGRTKIFSRGTDLVPFLNKECILYSF